MQKPGLDRWGKHLRGKVFSNFRLVERSKEEVAKEDEFLLRNWRYYRLIEKIKYKADIAGINVIIE